MSTTEDPTPVEGEEPEEEVEWPPEAEEPADEPSESTANDGTPGTAADLPEEEGDDSQESSDPVA